MKHFVLTIAAIFTWFLASAQQPAVRLCSFRVGHKPDSALHHFAKLLTLDGLHVETKRTTGDDCNSAKFWTKVFNKHIKGPVNLSAADQYAYCGAYLADSPQSAVGLNEYTFKNDSLATVVFSKMHKRGHLPIEAPEGYWVVNRRNKILLITFSAFHEEEFKNQLESINNSYVKMAK